MLITKKLIERSTWVPDLSSTQQKSFSFKCLQNTRDNQFNYLTITKPSEKFTPSIIPKKRKQIHWDDGQTQTITFHPTQTPTHMFGQSETLT